ncbi:nickel-responsive transcriptional regulator NikR, partial [Thermococci archaeon]
CLEVVVVKGEAKKIKKIADRLLSLKGVKHGKLVMTTTGKELV